jgi:hypothetical protein
VQRKRFAQNKSNIPQKKLVFRPLFSNFDGAKVLKFRKIKIWE